MQWSATSPNSSQCLIDTPRRVCSSYKNASINNEVARILSRGEYRRLARGTWVAQTGLHFPQRRQFANESAIEPISDCCMIKLSAPIRPKEGVYALSRLPPRRSLPALKCWSGSTLFLYSAKALSSPSVRNSILVMPIPCSPEITPSSDFAISITRATARWASCSIS